MTGLLFREYLRWFDKQMIRPTLLLINNYAAHEAGYEAIKDLPLHYIRVEFLPPNTTSLHQPCDQGIIRNFKAFYHRRRVKFMVE
jgi:DDE superfamily endonuclease